MAIFDLVLSMVGVAILMVVSARLHRVSQPLWHYALVGVAVTIPVAIVVHVLVGQSTALTRYIGLH